MFLPSFSYYYYITPKGDGNNKGQREKQCKRSLLLHNPERGRKRHKSSALNAFGLNYYYITPKGDGNEVFTADILHINDYYYITPKGDGN